MQFFNGFINHEAHASRIIKNDYKFSISNHFLRRGLKELRDSKFCENKPIMPSAN